jgi:amino-acid N-acetyltransferase
MAIIRDATAQDEAIIKAMIHREHLDPTSLHWQNFLVAEEDGQIVSIGQIKRYRGCEELGSLVTLPEYRGRGLATQLIGELESRAGRPLYLACNDKMEPYYQRFGYQRIGYWQAPAMLRLKLLLPLMFRLFGIRVIAMRKD